MIHREEEDVEARPQLGMHSVKNHRTLLGCAFSSVRIEPIRHICPTRYIIIINTSVRVTPPLPGFVPGHRLGRSANHYAGFHSSCNVHPKKFQWSIAIRNS